MLTQGRRRDTHTDCIKSGQWPGKAKAQSRAELKEGSGAEADELHLQDGKGILFLDSAGSGTSSARHWRGPQIPGGAGWWPQWLPAGEPQSITWSDRD